MVFFRNDFNGFRYSVVSSGMRWNSSQLRALKIVAQSVFFTPHPAPFPHGARGDKGKKFLAITINSLSNQ